MEIKKSHKADLEHKRPAMFAVGFITTIIMFFVVMSMPYVISNIHFETDEEVEMDLDIEPNDDKLIAAAEKERPKDPKSERVNPVEEVTEEMEELPDPEPLKPEEQELKETEEEEPPVNLNKDDEETKQLVDDLPQPEGGMVEFVRWLTKELQYPPTAMQSKITGKVIVSFIVEKDGSITDIKIEQRKHALLDAEALRVIGIMPKWKPGKDHGVVCRTRVAIPVVFEI